MASTRSLARALRLFTGVGLTVLEELADPNDAMINESEEGTKPKPKKQYGNKSRAAKPAKPKTKSSQSSNPPKTPKKNKQTTTDDTDKSDGNKSNGGNKQGKSKTQTPGKQPAISSAQKKAIQQLSLRRGLSETETQKQVFDRVYEIVNVELLLRRHSRVAVIAFLDQLRSEYKKELGQLLKIDKTSAQINELVAKNFRLRMAINLIRNSEEVRKNA